MFSSRHNTWINLVVPVKAHGDGHKKESLQQPDYQSLIVEQQIRYTAHIAQVHGKMTRIYIYILKYQTFLLHFTQGQGSKKIKSHEPWHKHQLIITFRMIYNLLELFLQIIWNPQGIKLELIL